MINDEDDIKMVMLSDSEYKLICSMCDSKVKCHNSWHKHPHTKITFEHGSDENSYV